MLKKKQTKNNMKSITAKPVELFNANKHKLVLLTVEVKPMSFVIVGQDLPKAIWSPNFKSTTHSKSDLYNLASLHAFEQSGFKLYSLNMEDFRDLAVIMISSLTELEFAETFEVWLKAKLKSEQTNITT